MFEDKLVMFAVVKHQLLTFTVCAATRRQSKVFVKGVIKSPQSVIGQNSQHSFIRGGNACRMIMHNLKKITAAHNGWYYGTNVNFRRISITWYFMFKRLVNHDLSSWHLTFQCTFKIRNVQTYMYRYMHLYILNLINKTSFTNVIHLQQFPFYHFISTVKWSSMKDFVSICICA